MDVFERAKQRAPGGEDRESSAAGDFGKFYAARKDPVFRAVLVAIGDRSAAEDAVAEAFTRAYVRWGRVRTHPNPTAWVLTTALNAQRSWWRRRRREALGDVPETALPGSVAGATGAGDLPTVLSADLKALVAELPRRQREVVALRLLADLSAEETGALLGMAPATVHVHLHRALASLRARLGQPATSTKETRG
jgi:RNA polymerase sigma-70 factor (sigma-E family)